MGGTRVPAGLGVAHTHTPVPAVQVLEGVAHRVPPTSAPPGQSRPGAPPGALPHPHVSLVVGVGPFGGRGDACCAHRNAVAGSTLSRRHSGVWQHGHRPHGASEACHLHQARPGLPQFFAFERAEGGGASAVCRRSRAFRRGALHPAPHPLFARARLPHNPLTPRVRCAELCGFIRAKAAGTHGACGARRGQAHRGGRLVGRGCCSRRFGGDRCRTRPRRSAAPFPYNPCYPCVSAA